MAKGMRFDVLDLQSGGIVCTKTTVFNAPEFDIQAEELAEADGSVIVKKRIKSKTFTCEGWMRGGSDSDSADVRIAALETLLDSFKRGLNKQNQSFDVDYAGSTRRWIATPRNIMVSDEKGLDTAGWSVEFFCASPVGLDTTSSVLLSSTIITSSSSTSGITVNGSYKAEPIITITVTSVTGGTPSKTITVSNDSTLRGISVTRDWSSGDVLEIDCLNKTVYVNNGVVEFGGQFPTWEPGNSGISYLDDFTARSVTISASYTVRYL